ncbi:MAG: alkaline phosphatase [Rikenellaceae bacterium]|nr:alkaline phosphatase [Rikenellaceae bacterium]MDE7356525.1 alkaline phosphatase [Rikenellaceae bacterium]
MKKCVLTLFLCLSLGSLWAVQPKYVFYFIGDGMGIPLLTATEHYRAHKNGFYGNERLAMFSLPIKGLSTTYCSDSYITDSAAAGTALATGRKTDTGMIGMTPDSTAVYSVAVDAKHAGKAVGVITSVSIDHATPASFYAHRPHRNQYHDIALDGIAAAFDLYGGAGLLKPVVDDVDVYREYEKAGYVRLKGRDGLKKLPSAKSPVVLTERDGASASSLALAIDRTDDDMTLADMVRASIDYLKKRGGDKGFFLMAEGGQIDWACHSNDAATAIEEVIDFDNAIAVAYRFYQKHPDETLIIVTADHETGGFALGNRKMGYTMNIGVLSHIDGSAEAVRQLLADNTSWCEARKILEERWSLGAAVPVSDKEWAELEKMYGKSRSSALDRALLLVSTAAGLGWTSGSHSAAPVIVLAAGDGLEGLGGMVDNVDIPKTLRGIINPR